MVLIRKQNNKAIFLLCFTFQYPNLKCVLCLVLNCRFYIFKPKVHELKLYLVLLRVSNKTFTFVKSTKNGAKTPHLQVKAQ